MIRTKLHVLAENIDPSNMQLGKDNKIIKDMLAAADFVVDADVVEMVKRDDCKKSVRALVKAGMFHLPYNPMVVEFEIGRLSHEFCYLHQAADGTIYGRPVLMALDDETAMVANFEIRARVHDNGEIMVEYEGYNTKEDSTERRLFYHSFAVSLHVALLMLNTKGIEKQVVEVSETLNRKRQSRGKPAIPHHSVVHIGTIYRRDGSAIKRGEGGWHMPMHWRCGYTRRQHFGSNRSQEKMVYIPPCIVNFKPEETIPPAPKRNVKV